MNSPANTSLEQRALELLASGVEQCHVASALGVTEGRISQILSQPEFAQQLAEKKFEQLAKHNATDNKYDALEKKVLDKLEQSLALVMDPMKLANIMTRLNQAKRRGASAPDSIIRAKPTVRLNINTAVVTRFALNGANQVVTAQIGEQSQDLVTIQSGQMQRMLKEHAASQQPLLPPPDVKHNSREWREYRKEERATVLESNGEIRKKPQGREKHDLLSECGFAEEIEITFPNE